MSDPARPVIGHGRSNVHAPTEESPLGSLVRFHDFARLEHRLQTLEAVNDELREQLRATKAELELTTRERDLAFLRLEELGETP